MFGSKYKSKGFTLVEILVVVGIIGTLSTVVVSDVNTSRAKGRDARRISDMKAVAQAIELYRIEAGGDAPYNSGWLNTSVSSELQILKTRGYLDKIPQDPKYTGNDNYYYRNITGNYMCAGDTDLVTYCVRFRTEKASVLGAAGIYCLTSNGIHKAGSFAGESATATNGFTYNCLQK